MRGGATFVEDVYKVTLSELAPLTAPQGHVVSGAWVENDMKGSRFLSA